ncbi:DNA mismatch repair endonuclease MutL [Thermodesulfobacteriota bacterium]
MSAIRILQEKVASQIAAGEVIERPASVLRELIDNSIDSHPNKIIIEIENGGKRSIRVSDDGIGMSRDDLLLSIERHATSKISNLDDLLSIKTLGFRGEALPSISAVSKTEITSRPSEQLVGHRLSINGGKLKSIEETGCPPGTMVRVRDLFFNMPARRKFLRAIRTETDHIIDTFARIALPLKTIHFRLEEGEKTLLNLPASENERNRISALMGRDVAKSMIAAQAEKDGLFIQSYLAPSDFSRSRGDRVFVYVNGRNIRDRLIMRAVMEGYGQRLMKGRYPQVALFITIDPSRVDVNVHPTKQEVRFHEGQMVYSIARSMIEEAIRSKPYVPVEWSPGRKSDSRPEQTSMVAEALWSYSGPEGGTEIDEGHEIFKEAHAIKESPDIIGQFKATYIICQTPDGLLLVDQHAAHERILYESLKKTYQSPSTERQTFLIPLKLEFSIKDGGILLKALDQINNLGLELEHFGGGAFLLRSVPTSLLNVEWEKFILDVLPQLAEEGDLSTENALDRIVTTMACHGAIRAGMRLSSEEMVRLLTQLSEADLPTNCPHGRPVSRLFSFSEIEKMFKRVL